VLSPFPESPARFAETRLVVPGCRSRRKTSVLPFTSFGTRFVELDSKTANRPSAEMPPALSENVELAEVPFPCVPEELTDTRVVVAPGSAEARLGPANRSGAGETSPSGAPVRTSAAQIEPAKSRRQCPRS
jgi:hypothetical protein